MKKPKDDIAKQLHQAQLTIVEHALIGFVEEVDGKVPNEETILREGFHVAFAPTPLSIFEQDGWKFAAFYCWRREHAVALGFLDPEDLLALKIVRVRKDDWPTALRLYIAQLDEKREKGPE